MSVAAGARWVLMTCLMTLACVTGIGAAAAHAEPMGAMHQMADAQPSGHDSTGHCTDTNQQCHQATVDNGLAFASSAQLAVPALTPAEATPTCLEPPASIARPPDLHALCVNRI
jgi:hypothetical protein